MGWSVGYDNRWKRDIGYGVPAYCDHPTCGNEIDRGLAHVCGRDAYGGDKGCGLYFCERHHSFPGGLCSRCARHKPHFPPKPDHPAWVMHKLTDESWKEWREANPEEVKRLVTSNLRE